MAWNKILPQTLAELFWPKVDREGRADDECWNWKRGRSSGYGCLSVTIGGKCRKMRSHVASWKLHCGSIPAGLSVLHKCDNKLCCNPSHLFLGTSADNIHDAVSKGRHAHGSKASYAKLTEEQVAEARALYDSNGRIKVRGSLVAMARRLGMKLPTLCAAAKGRSWRHLPSPATYRPLEFRSVVGMHLDGRHRRTNPQIKLTHRDVDQIRAKHSLGATRNDLAKEYGISRRQTSSILANESWRQ